MTNILDTIDYKGYQIRIVQDEDPESPREWDNLTHLVLQHKDWTFSNESNIAIYPYSDWDTIKKELEEAYNIAYISPVSLRNYSTAGDNFFDLDDSNQIGFIFITKEQAKQTLTPPASLLVQELKTYQMYVNGQIYGYEVVKTNTCPTCHKADEEIIDSCYGYYSDNPTNESNNLIYEAKEFINNLED